MMHKAWSSIEEVPYCFSRSSIKFQGHIALEIVEFETAKERCPIVFQDHPSNFKVTRDKTSPILTQIGRFGLQAGRSFQIPQICLVLGHPSNFKVTQAEKSTIWIQFEITRPVAAIKSLRFALFSWDQAALWMVQSVCLSHIFDYVPIIASSWKFSGVITNDRSDIHAKGQCQKSKVKVTEVNTQLSRFQTITPVWIHIWQWNDAQSLILLRRGALLFFKVIRQIARSHC